MRSQLTLSVSPHLAWLQVHTAIKLYRQPVFEAVEINDPVLDAALAAKFRAHLSASQQMPGRLFSFRLAAPQIADAGGWDAHGHSITTLRTAAKTWAAPSK
jgi:hypothetical protein